MRHFKDEHQRLLAAADDRAGQQVITAADRAEDFRKGLEARITAIVREADLAFESEGGSSRHWVRDQFLPRLEAAGLRVLPKAALAQVAAHVIHHIGVDNWPGHSTAWHCDICEGDERDNGHWPECVLFGETHQ